MRERSETALCILDVRALRSLNVIVFIESLHFFLFIMRFIYI